MDLAPFPGSHLLPPTFLQLKAGWVPGNEATVAHAVVCLSNSQSIISCVRPSGVYIWCGLGPLYMIVNMHKE